MTTVREPTGGASGKKKNRGFDRRRVLILVGALAAALVVALSGLRVQRKVQTDSAFCASSCHHDKPPGGDWHAIGHEKVACQSCHTTKLGTGVKLWWQSLIGSSSPQKHGKVDSPDCVACHDKEPAQWRLVAETQGHREHRGIKDVTCLSCHGKSTHEAIPAEKGCVLAGCHKEERLHKAASADAESCLSCHSFAVSAKHALQPTTVACEKCHTNLEALTASMKTPLPKELKPVNEEVLHGGVACQLCHNAHGTVPKPPEGQPVCARCHQFEIVQAGGTSERKGPEGHRDCEGCHKAHAPLGSAQARCVSCHEKNTKGLVGAKATDLKPAKGGSTTALKHRSCASCHQPHSWRAERSGCMTCHQDKAQLILTKSPPQHGQCTNCHEVHGPPPSGSVCVTCHAKTKGNHVALAPEKHKNCTSCHNPHAPSPKETRTVCVKCHQNQTNQVMRDGPDGHAKTTCFGCHKPHDNPLPPPDGCSKCHADKAKLVANAGPAKHRGCLSCHEKHVFEIKDAQTTCLSCHGAPKAGVVNAKAGNAPVLPAGGPHQGECKKCHAPHGSPSVPKTACFKCHDKLEAGFKPPNEQHANCRSCHTPHTAASAAIAKCATCHATKATVAAKWPANSAHAQACNKCHSQHDVKTKKACSTCHAAEATSAIGGKHQCTQCHAPHNAPPGTGAAWWTRCNECHAAKVESTKFRGKTHSECKNCHQTHKFAVPTCASCHKDISTKGLHAVEKHAAACNKCHDPHVKSEPDRAQCLACHTNRAAHQPDAKKCQACHVFK